ncbi:MAG TPA: hypothetical protein VGO50_11145 [Pyrinomonadaceae bacterium]|jgi:hypothetical protein|nr:hypothetical protein [Pyrinomonadaceae bacterium]
MKIRPLYKNLDTSFVDLSALLRYLRQRGFVGLVRVDIENYRAEINFEESHKVRMREFVNGTGRPADGSGALQRLLARARMAGGSIFVYEAVSPQAPIAEEIELDNILDLDQKLALSEKAQKAPKAEAKPVAPKIPKPVEKIFSSPIGKNGNGHANGNGAHFPPASAAQEQNDSASQQSTYDIFPMYSHQVEFAEEKPQEKPEEKASYLSAPDWEELTAVTAVLLVSVDDVLKAAKLGFPDAFNKARAEVSGEFPFLHPEQGIFLYVDGQVMLKEEVEPHLLVSGICECLRRILNKLIANPKFFTHYRHITQQIVILIRRRQPQFDKFGYTQKLEKIIKF